MHLMLIGVVILITLCLFLALEPYVLLLQSYLSVQGVKIAAAWIGSISFVAGLVGYELYDS